jgi:hypothetical protein
LDTDSKDCYNLADGFQTYASTYHEPHLANKRKASRKPNEIISAKILAIHQFNDTPGKTMRLVKPHPFHPHWLLLEVPAEHTQSSQIDDPTVSEERNQTHTSIPEVHFDDEIQRVKHSL